MLWDHLFSVPTEPFSRLVCRCLCPAPLLIPRATPKSPLPPQRPQWSPLPPMHAPHVPSPAVVSHIPPGPGTSDTHPHHCLMTATSSPHFTGEEAGGQGSGEALPSGCRVDAVSGGLCADPGLVTPTQPPGRISLCPRLAQTTGTGRSLTAPAPALPPSQTFPQPLPSAPSWSWHVWVPSEHRASPALSFSHLVLSS